jgi:hypothetical protein
MRKSTLFISAVLTTFMLAVLFGVASAYQSIVKSTQPSVAQAQAAEPAATTVDQMVSVSAPTQATTITPEAAATLASQVINRTDLFSAEITQLDGVDVYLVTFSSGDIVYVSLDGQILSISKLPVTIVSQPSHHGGNGGNNQPAPSNNGGSNGEGGGEHEGGND